LGDPRKPNTVNAHPHRAGHTVLVHNGIIENYESIKEELLEKGCQLVSETDSELFGHLIEDQKRQGLEFVEAVRTAFLRLHGSCSIVVVDDENSDTIVAVRTGTPLIAAHSPKSGGCFIASDVQAVLAHTNVVTYLENEDFVVCNKDGFQIYSLRNPIIPANAIHRQPVTLDWTLSSMDKAGFTHYMLKEIYEQPRAILDTLDNLIKRDTGVLTMNGMADMLKKAKKDPARACGTAWHAALIGKYILEKLGRIPVEVDLASEYRYRDPVVDANTLVLVVSQSGETADTIAALREAKRLGAMTAAICNVRGSTIAREAGTVLFTAAGPEIGVASTKAFTTQVLVLMMLGNMSRARGRAASTCAFTQSSAHAPERARDRQEDRRDREEMRASIEGISLHWPREAFPDRARGRAQDEGDQLHPRGRLSGRRAQTRPDRDGRSVDDSRGACPARRALREDDLQSPRGEGARRLHRRHRESRRRAA